MNSPRQNVDVAIIGLSCRFPGAVTAEEFWKNLCGGVESITFFSDQELVAAGADPSLVANPSYVKAAPLLRDEGGQVGRQWLADWPDKVGRYPKDAAYREIPTTGPPSFRGFLTP